MIALPLEDLIQAQAYGQRQLSGRVKKSKSELHRLITQDLVGAQAVRFHHRNLA
jgi:hypothetical protein